MNYSTSEKEQHLIAGILAGDEKFFYVLVELHNGWMYLLAEKILNNSHTAEDCVQESFIQIIRKIHLFEKRSSLKSWIRKILVNNCLMKLRKEKNSNECNIDDLVPKFDYNGYRLDSLCNHNETPEKLFDREENIQNILNTIHILPSSHKIVFLLRDIEGLTTREVSKVLECSEASVRVRLHRARSALKILLTPSLD